MREPSKFLFPLNAAGSVQPQITVCPLLRVSPRSQLRSVTPPDIVEDPSTAPAMRRIPPPRLLALELDDDHDHEPEPALSFEFHPKPKAASLITNGPA